LSHQSLIIQVNSVVVTLNLWLVRCNVYFFLILNYPSFPLFLFFFLSFSFLLFSSFIFFFFLLFFCSLSLSVIVLFHRVQINAIYKKEEEESGEVCAGLYIVWSRVYFPRRCYLCAANGWNLARLARPCGNGGPVSIEEFTLIVASIFPYIFCNFDTVELQKMYEKIKVSTSLHSRFSVLFL